MYKCFRTIIVLSVAAVWLFGCSPMPEGTIIWDKEDSYAAPGEKVILTFWVSNAGPHTTPYYEELIKQFEEKNPNIDVEYVGIPNHTNQQKYDAAIASDNTPDVGEVYPSWLASWAARGALLPLDGYFEKWSEKDKLNEGAVEFNRAVVADRKLYGIPNTQYLDVLWYRQDWFKEAGVKPPETWDEFFDAVEKMTDRRQNRFGYTIRGGKGGSFQLQRLMYDYSGISEYFDEDGKSTINHPEHVKFVKKYLGMYKINTSESDIRNSYKEMITEFDTGAVALVQHSLGSYTEHSNALQPWQFAALPLPKSSKGTYVVEGGNIKGYSIFKNTQHPDEAWKLVNFLCSAEAQSYWHQKIGQIPTHSGALQETRRKDAQHIQTALQVLDSPNTVYYNPPFYLPDYRSILDNIVDPGIQAVMSGNKTVEEFLNEWAWAIEKSKRKYDQGALHK